MVNVKKIKEWRAEEIAKIFLLKSSYKLLIDNYPTPLFDFFISLKNNLSVTFAVEVKTKFRFNEKLSEQLTKIRVYRDAEMINIPVLLFKIDEENESGEIDFLVLPSFKERKLLVRNEFKFEPLNQDSLTDKIDMIIKWHSVNVLKF